VSEEQVSTRIVTIPNLISFVRLAAVPVFWWLLLVEDRVAAATILLIVVSWTDWIDGYLARRLDQVTKLGKTLDPVADRLMIASAVIAGLLAEIVPAVIAIPLIVREAYMALVTLTLVSRGAGTLEVRTLGKRATFLVYGAVQSFYVVAMPFLAVVFRPIAWITGVSGLILYWIVAVQYTGDARRAMSELESAASLEES
jgi:cardiolipin synthase